MDICELHDMGKENGMPLITFLMDLGALPFSLACPRGCGNMALEKDKRCFVWKCQQYIRKYKNSKGEKYGYKQSIRKFTFFEKSNLTILQICKFVNLWVDNVDQNVIAKQCKIGSKATMTDWASFCREVCFDKMVVNAVPIGGPGNMVEIDESKFGKQKYHRGHRVEGQWSYCMDFVFVADYGVCEYPA